MSPELDATLKMNHSNEENKMDYQTGTKRSHANNSVFKYNCNTDDARTVLKILEMEENNLSITKYCPWKALQNS